MRLDGKIAIITGGSQGIGKATALLFAKEGGKIVVTGRTEKTLKETVEEARKEGLEIDYLVSDVTKEEDCKFAVNYTANKYGRIDILFNNAGVSQGGETHKITTETWDKTFDINVKGTFLMSKYTIPYMLKQGKGCIVNNSSTGGLKALPRLAAYCASKGAVTQLTRSMALEYADKGIRVNAVCAGIIETALIEGVLSKLKDRKAAEEHFLSLHPIGRLGRPEEIAHAVLFLCDDNVEFMTGTMLSIDGGWIAR